MNTYIILINYTEQGIRTIKQSPKRAGDARKLLKKLGGSMKAFYLTMGGPDMVAIVELPTDEAAAKFALTMGRQGNIRTTTLRAFDEAHYRRIVAAA